MYVVRESIDLSDELNDDELPANDKPRFHALIMGVEMGENDFHFTETCPSELQFEGTSKGFEGALSLQGADGVLYILVGVLQNVQSMKAPPTYNFYLLQQTPSFSSFFLLQGLCEGNFCAEGKKGKESGNGRLVVMSRQEGDVVPGFNCYWKTVKENSLVLLILFVSSALIM
jgi:hypothetical protein